MNAPKKYPATSQIGSSIKKDSYMSPRRGNVPPIYILKAPATRFEQKHEQSPTQNAPIENVVFASPGRKYLQPFNGLRGWGGGLEPAHVGFSARSLSPRSGGRGQRTPTRAASSARAAAGFHAASLNWLFLVLRFVF